MLCAAQNCPAQAPPRICSGLHRGRTGKSPWVSVPAVRWTPDQSHLPSHTHPHQVDGHWQLSSADLAGKEGQEVILLSQLQLGPACICPAALLPRKDRAAPHCHTHQARASAWVLVLLLLLGESCSVACSPLCSGQVSGKSGPHTGNLDPVIPPHSSVSSSER